LQTRCPVAYDRPAILRTLFAHEPFTLPFFILFPPHYILQLGYINLMLLSDRGKRGASPINLTEPAPLHAPASNFRSQYNKSKASSNA